MIYNQALIGYAPCGCAMVVTLDTPDDRGRMEIERSKMEARYLEIREVPLEKATGKFMRDNCAIHGNHWMYKDEKKEQVEEVYLEEVYL